MLSKLFSVGAIALFTPLVTSRAIITNQCPFKVYAWSVPGSLGRVDIEPGASFFEEFHRGTDENPGIAIKISTKPNGIFEDSDVLIYAYTVSAEDPSAVHMSLDQLRGDPYGTPASIFGCFGALHPQWPAHSTSTQMCHTNEDAEVVLCGFEPYWVGAEQSEGLLERDVHGMDSNDVEGSVTYSMQKRQDGVPIFLFDDITDNE